MEIFGDNGLKFKIDQKNRIASVLPSPKASGSVFIPRFVINDDIEYKVISIEKNAFSENKIQSITFPPDSEVTIFKEYCFHRASIKKLQIPVNLKTIEDDCFFQTEDLIDIEVSPKNHLFSYVEDKFLLGKKDESKSDFEVLIYARFDLKTALIPPSIKILRRNSINGNLKSLNFPKNTKIEEIEYGTLSNDLEKLTIPKTLKKIDNGCFLVTSSLIDIEISDENEEFSYVDNKYLLTKSNGKNFDQIIFCRRDVKDAVIPNYIKKICDYSFTNCKLLQSLKFESNSIIEEIGNNAFSWSPSPNEIIIPESLSKVGSGVFCANNNLKHIQFLGNDIIINSGCFQLCNNLLTISFPNAKRISFDVFTISKTAKILVRKDAELFGDITTNFKDQVEFIKETTKKLPPKTTVSKLISIEEDNYNKIINYVRFLENELSLNNEITPFNFSTFVSGKIASKKPPITTQTEENVFIGEEDEKQFEMKGKISEGSKSNVFKIFDHHTSRNLCKKVLKIDQEQVSFKDMQNALKEFEVLHMLNHPCICKSKFINISEKDRSSELTTISIYIEYLDYKLENILQNGMINNTMKVKIAVEIALGMSYLHKLGMIHRDLNISHIMLNGVFESKIIDFGLVKITDLLADELNQPLTKKVGSLAFMSPEMANEEDYDNKTDVYSYGVILYVMFGAKQIDQALKDIIKRKNNLKLPSPSFSINKNGIELIRKCLVDDPKERPSFDEIIDFMKLHRFSLADDVDTEIINRRIEEINRQVSISPPINKE